MVSPLPLTEVILDTPGLIQGLVFLYIRNFLKVYTTFLPVSRQTMSELKYHSIMTFHYDVDFFLWVMIHFNQICTGNKPL